ncbi:PepSY domain-containing protein [Erythrobacter sp. WH131]|uniref:PepSY domain-containing protein n=2 Tax=Erythrobacter ani TaxID=2827235 RepID=A0ABS6SNY5_9SPHN|nr:PepSY domain-containing protein [Erythrobacter ani]MBV7266740.1 PepSY domain-containing protein [Erythrobacter ani]
MRALARWHVWLGWLVGVPIVMWTATGLFMVAKPIEEVRGNHLRIAQNEEHETLPPGNPAPIAFQLENAAPIHSFETRMQRGRAVTFITYAEGTIERFDAITGTRIEPVSAAEARSIVAQEIIGGTSAERVTFFESDEVPVDFRRPMPVWRVTLEDGTHIYVGRETGDIEAVRTRWWRWFDIMWGLHIMDLSERQDTSHPVLILFAALASIGSLMGSILMFRRRRSRMAGRPRSGGT